MKEPKFYTTIRTWALILGAGGVSALQAMKMEIFTFPGKSEMYFGYFFSIITILCIFIGGFSVVKIMQDGKDFIGQLKDIKEREEQKADAEGITPEQIENKINN